MLKREAQRRYPVIKNQSIRETPKSTPSPAQEAAKRKTRPTMKPIKEHKIRESGKKKWPVR